ncbi:MAG: hypothetical protein ACHQJ4_06715 [Ignavibacteria bacterium]
MEKNKDNYVPVKLNNEDELSDLESHVLAGTDNKLKDNYRHNDEIIDNLKALKSYLLDKNVKWYKKSIVIATLAYFIKPKGALKNWDEFFDYLEDMGAIDSAVRFLSREIEKYY